MRYLLLPLLLIFVGCSLQKTAMRTATPIFVHSTQGMMKEANWDFFHSSAPANIKMMELFWQQDQDNLGLLSALIKSYSGYAYAVPETLYFQDELKGVDESPWKREAIEFYTRALDYGLFYLEKKGIKKDVLLSSDDAVLIKKLKELDEEEDAFALLYTGQAWGSLINLQKDNMALVSHVPKVKLLFDHACSLKKDLDHGVCDIFYAQYEASRPKMFGGNPEKGKKLYLEAIQKYPQNLLIRVNYIQYVLVPAMDADKYEEQAKVLREELAKWQDRNRDNLENISPYRNAEELNLYNAIALKRFLSIEENKKKIF